MLAKIYYKLTYLLANRLPRLLINPYERLINSIAHDLVRPTSKGWSVVIISGADDLIMLEKVLSSIDQELANTSAEIILIAPASLRLIKKFVLPIKHCPYRDISFLPPLITHKKNLGVKLAQYDKVVLCHDYLLFQAGWKAAWDNFGDDFDVASNQVLRQDGTRLLDWTVCDYPDLGFALLPYSKHANDYQYVSGSYFVVKRDFYLANPLDDYRRWGEGEDIEWSKRVRQKTIFQFNSSAVVVSAKFKAPDPEAWLANSLKLSQQLELA